jgi:hypothetical protein
MVLGYPYIVYVPIFSCSPTKTKQSLGAVLRIRDVYPGSEFFPSRIRIFPVPYPGSASKNLSILTQKIVISSRKYDPDCSSRIRIPESKRHRISDPDPQHCLGVCETKQKRLERTFPKTCHPGTGIALISLGCLYSSAFTFSYSVTLSPPPHPPFSRG